MLEDLRWCYKTTPVQELAERFGKTKAAVKAKARILGIQQNRQLSEEQKRYIEQHFANTLTKDVAAAINRNEYTINNYANRIGLKKDAQYMADTLKRLYTNLQEKGKLHRFPKGHVPANKGKKMPAEVYEKTKWTMFKKGNIPGNHRQVESERINKEGYIEIKIAEPNKWKLKHRLVWEQVNGKIPKGSNIQFKDGNRQNSNIDNLYIISRSEQIHNNSIIRYPDKVRTAICRVNKLIKLTN